MTLALPLRTERLVLRRAASSDYADLFDYYRRDDVCRYLPFDTPDDAAMRARLRRFLDEPGPDPESDAVHTTMVELEGRVIGDVMLRRKAPAPHSMVEIGWVFHPEVAGRGYATEAASALLDAAFSCFPTHRVFAQLDARNDASARLCERLGLQREAHLRQDYFSRGEWSDTLVYGMLRAEWEHGRT